MVTKTNSKKIKTSLFDIINTILICFVISAVVYPVIFVISASISDPDMVSLGKVVLLPKGITLEGYKIIFSYKPVWIGYRNTIFYTVVGTAINVVFTLGASYSLSRKDFLGRNFFMLLFTFTMFFSGGLIPLFLVVKKLNMIDKVWAMWLPGAVSMWNVIITRTYFQTSIPDALQEAAHIDGCTNMRLFISIVLPLSLPIIAVNALYYGVAHWNTFFNALIFISDRNKYPLQLFLREILIQNQTVDIMGMTSDEMEVMAYRVKLAQIMRYGLIIVSSIPILMLYPFLQKYFVKGMMIGSIKG